MAGRQPIHSLVEDRRRTCTYCCLDVVGRAYLMHGNQGSTSDWLSPPLDLFHPVASFSLACLIDKPPVCECVWCVCVCVSVWQESFMNIIFRSIFFVFLVLLPVKSCCFQWILTIFLHQCVLTIRLIVVTLATTTTAATTQLAAGLFGECLVRIFRRGFTRPSQSHVILSTWFLYSFMICFLPALCAFLHLP